MTRIAGRGPAPFGTSRDKGAREGAKIALVIELTSDRERLDIGLIHEHLSTDAYWAIGRPRELTERAFAASVCVGALEGGALLGWARALTDGALFAYVADVYVVPAARGRGVGKLVVEELLGRPELQGLRRILLATDDAHGLYERFGFSPLHDVEKWLQLRRA